MAKRSLRDLLMDNIPGSSGQTESNGWNNLAEEKDVAKKQIRVESGITLSSIVEMDWMIKNYASVQREVLVDRENNAKIYIELGATESVPQTKWKIYLSRTKSQRLGVFHKLDSAHEGKLFSKFGVQVIQEDGKSWRNLITGMRQVVTKQRKGWGIPILRKREEMEDLPINKNGSLHLRVILQLYSFDFGGTVKVGEYANHRKSP